MATRGKEQAFEHAMGEAKKQASHVAGAAGTAARKTAIHLKPRCVTSLKVSPTRLSVSHLPLDGYWVGCIGRYS